MKTSESSKAVDEQAFEELFRRYVGRLTELARSRLDSRIKRRVDADDIVQSAFRSFCRRVPDGPYELTEIDELWHLLATITIHKAHKAARRHLAGKRSVQAEESTGDRWSSEIGLAVSREPSPDEASILVEEMECLMMSLTDQQRQIFELRCQGYSVKEVSLKMNCSYRTIYRALENAKAFLQARSSGPDLS